MNSKNKDLNDKIKDINEKLDEEDVDEDWECEQPVTHKKKTFKRGTYSKGELITLNEKNKAYEKKKEEEREAKYEEKVSGLKEKCESDKKTALNNLRTECGCWEKDANGYYKKPDNKVTPTTTYTYNYTTYTNTYKPKTTYTTYTKP